MKTTAESFYTDQEHLTAVSYNKQDRLQVRIDTHRRYNQPQLDFMAWVLDHISWQGTELVIDIGCGSGAYWPKVQERGRVYMGGDLSWGMLAGLPPEITRLNLDAQQLPLADQVADVVLANHMLYHVPDLRQAVREARRVLRPDGVLLASTNSQHSRLEFYELVADSLTELGVTHHPAELNPDGRFKLENGRAFLEPVFTEVTRYDSETAFVFPSPEPALAYLASVYDWREWEVDNEDGEHGRVVTWPMLRQALEQRLDAHFAQQDSLRVSTTSGVFVCRP